ncbi:MULTISPECIES: hypothetical protein [Methylococcus]|uniref:Uncharacterized protein n=1 Tax=Methylococcus capsulatus TaxID=414 RepID=A0ABZ2F5N1_METCP|nr:MULTISPECIES: hypothetical protein [Methylococcus]MDF9391069.1 hypothetical protein [Methylococcus capsulatus]
MGERFVVAEMNTHHFMFRGAGATAEAARQALLKAWAAHRSALLAQYPEREVRLPEAERMEEHFKIYYLEFEVNAGYRWPDRLV